MKDDAAVQSSHTLRTRRISLSTLTLCLIIVATAFAGNSPPVGAFQATRALYLPMIMQAAAAEPTPPPRPDSGATGALHLKDLVPLRSADVQVDRQGGIHFAFTAVISDPNGNRPVYYAYCPPTNIAACANRATWQVAELGPEAAIVQLAVDSSGRPRMLMQSGSFKPVYRYAECNTACTAAASWRVVEVAFSPGMGSAFDLERSYHSFTLDPRGRPRFVFQFHSNDENNGAYYVSCDANCTDDASWQYTFIQGNIYFDEAVLAFTPAGQPRVVATNGDIPTMLVYIECNAECEDAANWSRPVPLYERGAGGQASWTFQVDAQSRPRMAFYPAGGPLYYVWCNDACTSSTNWTRTNIGLQQASGQDAALALDGQGRPRIAYNDRTTFGVGFVFCDTSCESVNGQWRGGVVESANQLNQAIPIKPFPKCEPGSWFGGLRTSLALDPYGNPRIAYDAEHLQRCYYGDPPNTSFRVETKWWVTRLVFFPKP